MNLKNINERRASVMNVVFNIGSETADRFDITLDEKEFAAIGYAIVHWAFLEDAIRGVATAIADSVGQPVPDAFKSDAFRPRLRAFCDLVEAMSDVDTKKYYTDLHARITNANDKRQHLVHGMWSYDGANPEFLIVDRQGNRPGQPKLFNAEAIIEFAADVSKISMALLHPGGLSVKDLATMREDGPFISREGHRMFFGAEKPSM